MVNKENETLYRLGMDLANFQMIKTLCRNMIIKNSEYATYRDAITNLASSAEKECYKQINERVQQ